MAYQIVKIFHIISVIGLLGPLILTPKWLHLYQDEKGKKILNDLHQLTGISGWIVFISGGILLWFQNFSIFFHSWMKVSIFLFLFIQIFDHFWADKIENKMETFPYESVERLRMWLIIKIFLYFLVTVLMIIK